MPKGVDHRGHATLSPRRMERGPIIPRDNPRFKSNGRRNEVKDERKAGFRNKAEIEQDRARIAEMYCRGKSLYEIAESLRLSVSLVRHDLAVVIKRWRASSVRNIDDLRARELGRLNYLEMEAWQAWHDSKKPTVKESSEMSEDDVVLPPMQDQLRQRLLDAMKGRAIKRIKTRGSTVKTDPNTGNVAFLEIILRISERRSKLLGLDKPIDPFAGVISLADVVELAFNQNDVIGGPLLPPPETDTREAITAEYVEAASKPAEGEDDDPDLTALLADIPDEE